MVLEALGLYTGNRNLILYYMMGLESFQTKSKWSAIWQKDRISGVLGPVCVGAAVVVLLYAIYPWYFDNSRRANTPSIDDKRPSRASAVKLPPSSTSRGNDSSDGEENVDDDDDEYENYPVKNSKKRVATGKPSQKKPEPRLVTKMRASRSLMLAKATAAAAAAVANSKPGSHQQQARKVRKRKRSIHRQQQQKQQPSAASSKSIKCITHKAEEMARKGRRVVVRNIAARSANAVPAPTKNASHTTTSSSIPPYNASLLDLENISSDEDRGGSRSQRKHQLQQSSNRPSREARYRQSGTRRPLDHHFLYGGEAATDSADGDDTFEERLDRHLATLRLSYIQFYKRMQTDSFKRSIKVQIAEEEEKKKNFVHQTSKLEKQIQFLIKDSQELLLSRLRELGVDGNTPNDLLVIAHKIVEGHKTLQARAREEQLAVETLEAEQLSLLTALGKIEAGAGGRGVESVIGLDDVGVDRSKPAGAIDIPRGVDSSLKQQRDSGVAVSDKNSVVGGGLVGDDMPATPGGSLDVMTVAATTMKLSKPQAISPIAVFEKAARPTTDVFDVKTEEMAAEKDRGGSTKLQTNSLSLGDYEVINNRSRCNRPVSDRCLPPWLWILISYLIN